MFIVTIDPDGEPDRKMFSDLTAAKKHAEVGRLRQVATTIHQANAATAREALAYLEAGSATLVEARNADLSDEEKRRRVAKKQGDDLMRQLF